MQNSIITAFSIIIIIMFLDRSKTKEEEKWNIKDEAKRSIQCLENGRKNAGCDVDTNPWSVMEKPPSPTKAKT